MKFRCRRLEPSPTVWIEVEACTPEQAANDFHFEQAHGFSIKRDQETVIFASIEVEDHGSWVARMFKSGIYRRGGVPKPWDPDRLPTIAKRLGCNVSLLTDADRWEGEEEEYS